MVVTVAIIMLIKLDWSGLVWSGLDWTGLDFNVFPLIPSLPN